MYKKSVWKNNNNNNWANTKKEETHVKIEKTANITLADVSNLWNGFSPYSERTILLKYTKKLNQIQIWK